MTNGGADRPTPPPSGTRPDLRQAVAIERYKREEVTLNRAAELAGISVEEMKRALRDEEIEIRRGALSEEARDERARELASA